MVLFQFKAVQFVTALFTEAAREMKNVTEICRLFVNHTDGPGVDMI